MSSSFFIALSFILLAFGSNIGMIFAARFLQVIVFCKFKILFKVLICIYFYKGCGVGVANTALSIYVGEIATVEYRGALGSFMQLFVTSKYIFIQ